MAEVKKWTKNQDQALSVLFQRFGQKKWKQISKHMQEQFHYPKRTSKQYRERWLYQLNPSNKKTPFTSKQYNLLFDAYQQHGSRWIKIAQHLPGRNQSSVKNAFFSIIRKTLRRISKLVGNKKSTKIINKIKPAILIHVFNSTMGFKKDFSNGFLEQIKEKDLNQWRFKNFLYQNCKDFKENFLQFSRIQMQDTQKKQFNQERLKQFVDKLSTINILYENYINEKNKQSASNETLQNFSQQIKQGWLFQAKISILQLQEKEKSQRDLMIAQHHITQQDEIDLLDELFQNKSLSKINLLIEKNFQNQNDRQLFGEIQESLLSSPFLNSENTLQNQLSPSLNYFNSQQSKYNLPITYFQKHSM